jgi:hypothetical protein
MITPMRKNTVRTVFSPRQPRCFHGETARAAHSAAIATVAMTAAIRMGTPLLQAMDRIHSPQTGIPRQAPSNPVQYAQENPLSLAGATASYASVQQPAVAAIRLSRTGPQRALKAATVHRCIVLNGNLVLSLPALYI